MIIRYYWTSKFEGIAECKAKAIEIGQEDYTEEEKRDLREGKMIPMLCFERDDNTWISVPIQFVIDIVEE